MVYDGRIARTKLDCGDQAIVAHARGKDKVLMDVGTIGGDGKRLFHFQDQVRLAETPAGGEFRRGRSMGRIALRLAIGDPAWIALPTRRL